jgi:hypothetical protein
VANASFSDVAYQLMRVYRNRNYIADLSFGPDAFMGLLEKRGIKTTGGQADVVTVAFDGAGVPSNTAGTIGTAAPSQGVQFLVTPARMTNLAGIDVLAAAAGTVNFAALVKPLKHEIDQAIRKVSKIASIELWSNGFPALGQTSGAPASTTLTLIDPDDIVKFSVGDIIFAAPDLSTSAATGGTVTVQKILTMTSTSGTMQISANVNTFAGASDYLFLSNTRGTGAAPTKVGITGIQGWLPSTADTLFSVDRTVDARLIGTQSTGLFADIEGAFIDALAQVLTTSANGTKDITAFMHPKTWAYLAKAMQSRTVNVMNATPMTKKGREGSLLYSGYTVATPNGIIEVFTPQFCPKNKIFMLNMTTWSMVGWGLKFPTIIANPVGAAPPIFMDPSTGNITCAVGGFPQLECNAPGFNHTVTLS